MNKKQASTGQMLIGLIFFLYIVCLALTYSLHTVKVTGLKLRSLTHDDLLRELKVAMKRKQTNKQTNRRSSWLCWISQQHLFRSTTTLFFSDLKWVLVLLAHLLLGSSHICVTVTDKSQLMAKSQLLFLWTVGFLSAP